MNKNQLKNITIKGHEADTIQHLMFWILLNYKKFIPKQEHNELERIQRMLIEKYYAPVRNDH